VELTGTNRPRASPQHLIVARIHYVTLSKQPPSWWVVGSVRVCCLYLDSVVGGFSVGETPGPIPNPEAKPFSADGTALGRVWESRTLPAFNLIVGGWFVAMDIAGTNPPLFFCRAIDDLEADSVRRWSRTSGLVRWEYGNGRACELA